jgi:hypothetical protein
MKERKIIDGRFENEAVARSPDWGVASGGGIECLPA